jgi:hypothetical protein
MMVSDQNAVAMQKEGSAMFSFENAISLCKQPVNISAKRIVPCSSLTLVENRLGPLFKSVGRSKEFVWVRKNVATLCGMVTIL